MAKNVDQFRFRIKGKEFVPIMIGGMGVDISSDKLALVASKNNGVGHISDAMIPTVTDRHFSTKYSKEKHDKYKENKFSFDKTKIHFDLEKIKEATKLYVDKTISANRGNQGLIFINCMEKLLMNNPRETLQARLCAALDGGIDGITLSAGLHLNSFELMADNPRFHDASLGIIISSIRALKPFLKRGAKYNRMPDYIIVEGPEAGGHLGFGDDWAQYKLRDIFIETRDFLKENDLNIPLIAAGGVFTGTDAVDYLEIGAAAVQVATRFTVSKECGLPDRAKQKYFEAEEKDIIVSHVSPTGYPMRILTSSPALTQNIRPGCETYGFLLDKNGNCSYIDSYEKAEKIAKETGKPILISDKVCLCTHMRNYKLWTCGSNTYRLKDTTIKDLSGEYQLLDAEHIFNDYRYSENHQILLPNHTEQVSIA